MKREEQIKEAAAKYCATYGIGEADVFDTVADFVEGAEWADQHPNWIAVEERLPEYKWVLVCVGGKGYDIDIYKEGIETWAHNGNNVTHWMEIVPPRKEDKE